MPLAITCTLNGENITVGEALEMRGEDRRVDIDFRCGNCGERVRPHSAGGHMAAHFEHLDRNANCPLSHPAP